MSRRYSRSLPVQAAIILLAFTVAGLAGLVSGCRSQATWVRTVPADRTTSVYRLCRIGVEFDRPMDIDSVARHVRIEPPVAGGWEADQNLIYITPVEPLLPETTYTITLLPGATDVRGNKTESAGQWTFVTTPIVYSQLPTLTPRPQIELPGVRALAAGPEGKLYAASAGEVAAIDVGRDGSAKVTRLYGGFSDITDLDVDDEGRVWLLIAEKGAYRIVRLTAAGQADLTMPIEQPEQGAGAFCWFYPRNLAILPGGHLLVLGTDRLRQYTPAGEVEREIGLGLLAGGVTEEYFGPTGLVLDGSTVYVNNGLAECPRGPEAFELPARHLRSYPIGVGKYTGLARDRWGNLYLQDDGNLMVLGPDGDPLGALLELPEWEAYAYELLVYGDVLYAACPGRDAVLRWHLTEPQDNQCLSHADRLIRGAFEISVDWYRVGSLWCDWNGKPLRIGDLDYRPVTDRRVASYQEFEAAIRGVYAPELAARYLADPKYIEHEGKLYGSGGEAGSRLQYWLYRYRLVVDRGDEVEIELTIPAGEDPPNVSRMRFRLVDGQWRIAHEAFGT